ncbi:S8 family peptidase [Faecalibacter sp. LW9]|uniref:S8 family peptidase n=1 Tax=Faecalibacter sp. LW9 TaxID=3103144 RepID=UPI002AFEB5B1|nr:S8 family peptidase [Faecalibacter sp. LW9]
MKKKLLSLALITLVYGGVNAQTTERLKEKFNTETANKNAFIDAIQMKGGSSFLHEKRDVITEISNDHIAIVQSDDFRANNASNIEQLQAGAVGGFALNGENMSIAIFDGGKVLPNHNEFKDLDNTGQFRVIDLENGAQGLSDHATSVAGFIIAEGGSRVFTIPNAAKGVLPKAIVKHAGFADTSNGNRFTKILEYGEYISNHSYGVNNGWSYNASGSRGAGYYYSVNTTIMTSSSQTLAGAYQSNDQAIDEIVYADPKFAIVKSAGNYYGTVPGPNDNKYRWSASGYVPFEEGDIVPDANCAIGAYCIGNGSLAKNIIVVGAIDLPTDATTYKFANTAEITRSSYSSAGPRKDGAIKPDLAAVGTLVIAPTVSSTNTASVNTYTRGSGTSYSAPKVTGTIGSLTQLKRLLTNDNEFYFFADEVKAILTHTAMEAGNYEGPDNWYGWGVLDGLKAAEVVLSTHNNEDTLERKVKVSGVNDEKVISAREGEDLKVTISWIDPAAELTSGTLNTMNDTSSKLVNDFDLRVIDTETNEVYYPWKLELSNPTGAAVKGDNTVDNIEQVLIKNPVAGRNYRVVVSNKGTLVNDEGVAADQNYTLLITGANAEVLSTSEVVKSKISVYPTVAKDVVNIKTQDKIQKVDLIDLTGKLISTSKKETVDVSSLSSGVYILNVVTDKGTKTQKIVKQ